MAPSKRTPTLAEIALVPLKSCLVNLPSPLVSLLVNANTPAQNVIVELQHRGQSTSPSNSGKNGQAVQKSTHVGWTGMPSKRKLAPVVTRDGINGTRGQQKDQDVAVLEIDSTFGRVLGLSDGQKVGVLLHLDPPVAHTVNIEPLTPADWEIIELHANFLELNLLSQIRALPNPAYAPSTEQAEHTHPLTLHLSPTSTANITVTSLTPQAPSTSPFAKISPDAEVIVAPKVRPKTGRSSQSGNRSTASTGRRSQGARSVSSAQRPRSSHSESSSRGALFLRAVDRKTALNWFEDDSEAEKDEGLKVWIDRDVLLKNELRGSSWACVSIIRPAALQAPIDPQQQAQQKELISPEAGSISRKLVARLLPWDESPDTEHVALSSLLCSALEFDGAVGGVVRIEAAPSPIQKPAVKTLKLFPFGTDLSKKKDGFRFGGDSASSRDAFVERLKMVYGSPGSDTGMLSGPITDGMFLPKLDDQMRTLDFDGGMIKFDPPLDGNSADAKLAFGWVLGSESKIAIEVQAAIPKPPDLSFQPIPPDEVLPTEIPKLVGIKPVITNCMSNLTRASSILLTGGLGSGKTSLAHLLAHQLREDHLFNVTYFPCRKLLNEETRISAIKETLRRLFLSASWCARLGGNSVVVLDDLDKLCPVETELQVGGENGRSRQISEIVCSTVREFCSASSPVVLLATAQAKESLNNVIIGGHVVREIISLKSPNKDGRRLILEQLTKEDKAPNMQGEMNGHIRKPSSSSQDSWLNPSNSTSRPGSSGQSDGFVLSRDLDFLDLAGKTDGYMPGDLVLLVSRARNEALISAVQDTTSSSTVITLGTEDFDRALKGFTPASLRNVTLTSSSTTFSAIGGLHSTRNTLLETLQYPTKYAPIFSQCPLRLRSGLLLYGFPGCGKTLLASAVAGECGLNFISVKGPEILNKYIGASEKSVRDLFERAEAARPCILFFDEFDSIAPKRGHDSTGVTDRVVNQLLTQMDGAEGLSGVYVLAATSRPDLIDPALLRPGRLDKSLLCDMPNHADRVDIIQALSGKLKLSDDVMSRLYEVAGRTEGYSGADLQAVVYNAHLEAIHDALGDRTPAPETTSKSSKKSKTTSSSETTETSSKSSQASKPFIQFLYDSTEHSIATTSRGVRNTSLDPPAVIAAKIEELKKARLRQKQAQRNPLSDPTSKMEANKAPGDAGLDDEDKDSDEICIEWTHIERSLATTRCSISAVERKRLESIYREFIVGRNGEMPTGEGARDVGGRTTLM
ncbi:peroxisome biosynthesis protein PAS1 [Nannizzia gypsea CBS 118893]|uniref:Peroxisomal ATPase PEX1 n=1 Tax=Arthroderma gypseum (strain ATCC MYA-4604 / CBS 118893) TaxID=535722 RepID=E4UVM8_ARTGP|nr:peroxisome biosynthesis protein PAS1 [Nannizzia gypsea CBS 118893]EFR02355.1 peroxisome biosynthesis protein PAS1 [Nannizzia gypsea CBS 118893]